MYLEPINLVQPHTGPYPPQQGVRRQSLAEVTTFGIHKEKCGFLGDVGNVAKKPFTAGAKGLSHGLRGVKFVVAQPFVFGYNTFFSKTVGNVKVKAKYTWEEGLKLRPAIK